MAEWFLFLPQFGTSIPDLVERARTAEASGFTGIALIDHLVTPGAEDHGLWEAMTLATWVAAATTELRIGHLVLCDAFRHPAVLAKQAVTLDHASNGRFELGLGSGSWPQELRRFDITEADAKTRAGRLAENLESIRRYWGERDDGSGAQTPLPQSRIPVVIGGTGPTMLDIVRRHADWWNIDAPHLDRLPELMSQIGSARVSVQQAVGFVRPGDDPERVRAVSLRRLGNLGSGLICGDAPALVEHFARLRDVGVERFYVWFADRAAPASLREFGETVIGATGPRTDLR